MRVTVKGHEIQGTATEIAQLLALVDVVSPPTTVKPLPVTTSITPFVSETVAHKVLTRRELGDSHTNLLSILYQAGDKWTAAPELQGAMDLTTREFAGVLGSFGKRVSNTEGAGSRNFLDQYWDADNGHNLYRLPPAVRSAMERAKVVP